MVVSLGSSGHGVCHCQVTGHCQGSGATYRQQGILKGHGALDKRKVRSREEGFFQCLILIEDILMRLGD